LPSFNVYSGLPPAPPDRYAANVDGYDGYYTKILNSGTAYFTMTNTSSFGKWWDTQWATSTTHGGNDYYLDIDADVLGTNYVLPYWTNACGISAPGPSVILEVILGKSANQEEISFGLSPNPAEQYVDIKLNLPEEMKAVGTYWAEFVNPYSVVAKKVELDGPENRVSVADLPKDFTLDDSMAMSPDAKLSSASELRIEARISKTGDAIAKPGDLSGELSPVKPGATGLKVVIDKILP